MKSTSALPGRVCKIRTYGELAPLGNRARRPLGRRDSGFKELFRLLAEQDPEPVNADDGSEGDVQEAQDCDDDADDARPGTHLEEADAGDQARQRDHD